MVPVLEMMPPAWLMMPLLPPEFDIVMVPELVKVPPFLMPTPPEFDIVMVPLAELVKVPPESLKMPILSTPEF